MGYSELNKILDDGTKKNVPYKQMTKKGLELYWKYQQEEANMNYIGRLISNAKDEINKYNTELAEWTSRYNMVAREIKHMDPPYNEPNPALDSRIGMKPRPPKQDGNEIDRETWEKFEHWNWIGLQPYNPKMDEMLFRHFNIKPFEPWVMLNISPNWKNKKITRSKICELKRTFESYLKEEWYSEWKYVLEAGGNGDHLHLHAVCKMNKERNIKSVRTHLSKHWKRQVIKHWKDVGGSGGSVQNPGMQAIIIQGSEGEKILNDKIDYLDEEKKPIGHKNKTPKALEKVLGVLIEGSL